MNAQERGDLSEKRAYRALKTLQQEYAGRFRRLRRSSPAADARGIDFFIEVRLFDRQNGWMTVPIEIKSSQRGVEKWGVTHPEHFRAGVLHFYVRDSMSNKQLRGLIFRVLNTVRKKSRDGTLYHSWFQKLFSRPMSRRGKENVERIRARRNRGPH